tara:strand:+ start:149 stop:1279 length:1131 start_codon:yes stop_codon:yes gene_type:complete
MVWITFHTRHEVECIICKEKIPIGEQAERNEEEMRHQKCGKMLEIEKLRNEARELEDAGKQNKAEELHEKADHFEFQELLKNYDKSKAVITEEQEKMLQKELEESQLRRDAKNYDYPEFLNRFKKLYLLKVKDICGDHTFVKLSKVLRDPLKARKLEQDIGIKHFNKWTKLETFLISKDTPEENKEHFRTVFSKCQDYIYWNDRYLEEEGIEYLLEGIVYEKIKEIKLLFTIFGESIHSEMKNQLQKIRNDLSQKDINCIYRVSISRKLHKELHDRFILGSNIAWNAPSVGQIKKNQLSEITESPNHDKLIEKFQEFWDDSSCLDLIKDWDRIEFELQEQGVEGKYYRRKCMKCGERTSVYKVYKDKPICKKCPKF